MPTRAPRQMLRIDITFKACVNAQGARFTAHLEAWRKELGDVAEDNVRSPPRKQLDQEEWYPHAGKVLGAGHTQRVTTKPPSPILISNRDLEEYSNRLDDPNDLIFASDPPIAHRKHWKPAL